MRLILLLVMVVSHGAASAQGVARAPFGTMPDGRAVEAITLAAPNGVHVTVLTLGATLQSVLVADRAGHVADVVLGHADPAGYLSGTEYFGASVGRYANRIAGGRFTLDAQAYQLPLNNKQNTLHGGTEGFDKRLWTVSATAPGSVTLRLVSPAGDQGYPGELTATAHYALADDGTLTLDYEATTSASTVVNLTNHAYWNLAGEAAGDALAQHLTIAAETYLPTDPTAIPTGEFRPVAGTDFDFRAATAIGARVRDAADPQIVLGHGYDHNWVVAREASAEPRPVARLSDPKSGRVLDLASTEPGLQFYSGNFLDGTVTGKSGNLYRQGDGVALEPQRFPDTPNQPSFGSARLDPGQTYRHRIVYRFSTAPPE